MSNHVDSDHGNKLLSGDDGNSTNAAYGSGGKIKFYSSIFYSKYKYL